MMYLQIHDALPTDLVEQSGKPDARTEASRALPLSNTLKARTSGVPPVLRAAPDAQFFWIKKTLLSGMPFAEL
jgi:hypothetical protein